MENERYTYNKAEKLKSQKAIEQLFTEGRSVSAYPLRLVYGPMKAGNVFIQDLEKHGHLADTDELRSELDI